MGQMEYLKGGSKAVMLRGMCDLLLDLIYLKKISE